jgi:HPt (histidine-containing phosphotransfer) domain-containing protein
MSRMLAELCSTTDPPRLTKEAPDDMEPLVSLKAGDPVFSELLSVFLTSLRVSAAELRVAAQGRRYADIKHMCHKARGSAGTFGFPKVVACLAELESAALRGEEHEVLVKHLAELERLMARVALAVPSE